MGNSIDLIVSKNAQQQLDDLYKGLQLTHDEIVKISKLNLDFFGGTTPKNPAQLKNVIKDFDNVTKASDTASKKIVQNTEKIRLAEIKLQQQREKAFDKYEAQLNKEQAKLSAAEQLYNRVQARLSAYSNEYKNLAVQKELFNNLTQKEENRMNSLERSIKKYDTTLKAVDATMGKHQRNVGNYAIGFNPLSNSINQIGREMPAFVNSVQTGFMAISNNLPIFFDAMDNVIAQNKELQAQGLPTKSVLSQVASSLFSFQTLLSVGVTLLTIYGAEIIKWTSSLLGAEEALTQLNEVQNNMSKNRKQTIVDIQNEYEEYKRYKKIATDANLPIEERKVAYEKLRSLSDWHMKNLTDQELASTKLTRREEEYVEAKKQSIKYQNELKNTDDILTRIENINSEIEAQIKYKKTLKELEDIRFQRNGRNDDVLIITQAEKKIIALKTEEKLRKESVKDEKLSGATITSLLNEKINLQDVYNQSLQKANTFKEKSILLEYKEKNAKDLKEISDLEIDQADFLAKDYELRKLTLDNLIKNNDEVVKNESESLEERINAYNRFTEYKNQLILLEYDEQNRLIDKELSEQTTSINKSYNDQLKKINNALKEGTTTQTIAYEKRNQAIDEKNQALKSLEKKVLIDRNILTEKFVQDQKTLSDEYEREVVYKMIQALEKLEKQNEISQNRLNALSNRNFTGGTLNLKSPLKAFKDYYEEKDRIEQDSRVKSLELEIKSIDKKTLYLSEESEEYEKLISQKIALEIQLQELKDANRDKEVKATEELKKTLEDFYKGFGQDLANKSGFTKFFDILNDGLEKFKGNAKATGLAVSEAFQEAFNTITSNSEAYYEREFNRLSQQKELSLKFAGESTSAKEEIERQYEQRRKSIERKKAEQEKQNAIFNAIIDTAQAVVASLPNIPLSIAVGLIGAAQIALISSQQIPAYEHGTLNHKGGAMLINDGKGSDYKEIVKTPDGNIEQYNGRNVIIDKPKGTKVFTAKQWDKELNKMLTNAGISMNRDFINIEKPINNDFSRLEIGIENLTNTIKNKESFSFYSDRNGERIYREEQGRKTELLNNRLNIKSFNV